MNEFEKIIEDFKDMKSLEYCPTYKSKLIDKILYIMEQKNIKITKIINKLNEDNNNDQIEVKKYEEMRRHCTNNFYKDSYQKSIHELNSKRQVRNEIISFINNLE